MTVSLQPSQPSPAHVGEVITWSASAIGAGPGTLWYRFRVRRIGGDFRVIKDYGPDNSFAWTASDHEGTFEIEASARSRTTGAIATAKSRFEMLSNITGHAAGIHPTSHPMVFLYSAPPCATESRMRVRFEAPGEQPHFTPWQQCKSGLSMNFYLAGMYPQTPYTARHMIDSGFAIEEGPAIHFATRKEAILPATEAVVKPIKGQGLLLQSTILKNVVATDLEGKLLWYYAQPVMLMTDPQPGGYFWATTGGPTFGAPPGGLDHEAIREFDVAGMTITETNVARVNEQLAALGKSQITGFHHEAERLPDGRVLALGMEERILVDVQGPGPVDVIGDVVIIMDRDLRIIWVWDAFEHLDVKRLATLGETCVGCASLAKIANDWTHVNAVQQTPDGNLLISARNQDFIYKLDYENGEGDGHVIWKLGNGGDFKLNVSDPLAWFSHQHDARYTPDGAAITLYDDSNVRQSLDPKAHSRGQALRIDETNMTADLILNADLGVFSSALGSAQQLANGNYMFLSGFLSDNTSLITEVDPQGNIIYELHTGAQQYRTFFMRDLYSQPE